MSLASDLLRQARHLAALDPKRPSQANLRRSVSAAYYALFHFVAEESTLLIIGTAPNSRSLRNLAARALSHTKMRSFCAEFAKETPTKLLQSFWAIHGIDRNSEISAFARTFCDLQQSRHEADYDLSELVFRADAFDVCDRVAGAIAAWHDVKAGSRALAEFFAVCLLLWPGLGQR